MANISSLLNTIKNAIYGIDMRSALHDAIKAVNDDAETRLKRSGGTMTGGITMNGNKITSSATPSTDNDCTNKKYVDAQDKAYATYSNANHPNSTTVKNALDEAFSKIDEKGQPNGYAELDADGLIPTDQLPPLAITDTYPVSSQSEMLALNAQVGDVAVRTDLSKSFILRKEPASTLANWQELLTPTDLVQSVAGKTGVVVLTKSDVGLSNVDNTADANKNVLTATKLKTARKINGVDFDGSKDITVADSTKEPKITAGASSQMWIGTKNWVSISPTVQGVSLTGLSTATNSAITASDTIITALGKLQAQINDISFIGSILSKAHSRIFRGRNLGSSVTAAQKAAIKNGSFDDLFLGDYWVIGGVIWRIVDMDYWWNTYSTDDNSYFEKHHLVIMPDTCLGHLAMNESGGVVGGYVGSDIYNTYLSSCKTIITNAFGDLVLTHGEYLVNAITNGKPSGIALKSSSVEIPSEIMIYGTRIMSPGNDGTTISSLHTYCRTQLALFDIAPRYIVVKADYYWLRDVVSSGCFAYVASYGNAGSFESYYEAGVRPVFSIG